MLLIGGILGRRAIQILVGGNFQRPFSRSSNQKFGIVFWIPKMKANKTEATLKFKKEKKELVASQTEVKICEVDRLQIQKNSEKEDRTVDTEFDREGDKANHMGSLMDATAVKVQRGRRLTTNVTIAITVKKFGYEEN